jgi:hypothetical protein
MNAYDQNGDLHAVFSEMLDGRAAYVSWNLTSIALDAYY